MCELGVGAGCFKSMLSVVVLGSGEEVGHGLVIWFGRVHAVLCGLIFISIVRHVLHRGCRNCRDLGAEKRAVLGRFSWLHCVGVDVDWEGPVFTPRCRADVFKPDAASGSGNVLEVGELKATPFGVGKDLCHVAVVVAGLALNSSNGVGLLL